MCSFSANYRLPKYQRFNQSQHAIQKRFKIRVASLFAFLLLERTGSCAFAPLNMLRRRQCEHGVANIASASWCGFANVLLRVECSLAVDACMRFTLSRHSTREAVNLLFKLLVESAHVEEMAAVSSGLLCVGILYHHRRLGSCELASLLRGRNTHKRCTITVAVSATEFPRVTKVRKHSHLVEPGENPATFEWSRERLAHSPREKTLRRRLI